MLEGLQFMPLAAYPIENRWIRLYHFHHCWTPTVWVCLLGLQHRHQYLKPEQHHFPAHRRLEKKYCQWSDRDPLDTELQIAQVLRHHHMRSPLLINLNDPCLKRSLDLHLPKQLHSEPCRIFTLPCCLA